MKTTPMNQRKGYTVRSVMLAAEDVLILTNWNCCEVQTELLEKLNFVITEYQQEFAPPSPADPNQQVLKFDSSPSSSTAT